MSYLGQISRSASPLEPRLVFLRQSIQDPKADIVPGLLVLLSRVAEANDQVPI